MIQGSLGSKRPRGAYQTLPSYRGTSPKKKGQTRKKKREKRKEKKEEEKKETAHHAVAPKLERFGRLALWSTCRPITMAQLIRPLHDVAPIGCLIPIIGQWATAVPYRLLVPN